MALCKIPNRVTMMPNARSAHTLEVGFSACQRPWRGSCGRPLKMARMVGCTQNRAAPSFFSASGMDAQREQLRLQVAVPPSVA